MMLQHFMKTKELKLENKPPASKVEERRSLRSCHHSRNTLLRVSPNLFLAAPINSAALMQLAPFMAAFVLQALFPCLTLLSPSMADGVQKGNIGAALVTKTWPAFAPKMCAALTAPFAPKMWPAFVPKMCAALPAPFVPKMWLAFASKVCAALGGPFTPKCFAPIKATEEADVPPFPACVLFGSQWPLPSALDVPSILTWTPHGAHLGRDPPHTLGRGTLLTCGDVEENPGPKGGKPGQARRARGNSPPGQVGLRTAQW